MNHGDPTPNYIEQLRREHAANLRKKAEQEYRDARGITYRPKRRTR